MGFLIGYNIEEPSKLIVKDVELETPPYVARRFDYKTNKYFELSAEQEEEMRVYDDFYDRLKRSDIPAEQRPFFEEASKLGMTHWTYDEEYYGDNYCVAYNVGEQPEAEFYGSEEDRGDEKVREYTTRDSRDHVFIHTYETGLKEVTQPNWKKRDQITSVEVALQCMVHFISKTTFLSEEQMQQVKEFADKWNIPFNCDLHTKFIDMWTELHPRWNSSSAYC